MSSNLSKNNVSLLSSLLLSSPLLSSVGYLSSLCLLFVTSETDAALLWPNITLLRVKGAEARVRMSFLDTSTHTVAMQMGGRYKSIRTQRVTVCFSEHKKNESYALSWRRHKISPLLNTCGRFWKQSVRQPPTLSERQIFFFFGRVFILPVEFREALGESITRNTKAFLALLRH